MKKNRILFFKLFICALAFAQKPNSDEIIITFGREYREAEVTFKDNVVKKGYLFGFLENSFIEVGNPMSNLMKIEKKLNLLDNHFKFKNSIDDNDHIVLSQDDIKEVKIKEFGKLIKYKLLSLKTVNVKGEIVDLDTKAWLPLYSSDRVNIFAYTILVNKNYFWTPVYLNKEDEDFAISPIDINRINVFNIGKIDDKIIVALKEVFKDCPNYVKIINEDPVKKLTDNFQNSKEQKEIIKKFEQENKELPKKDKKKKLDELKASFLIQPFLNFINEYKSTCPN